MSAIITSDLIEALSQCRRKAFFICRANPIGVEHEYVQIMRLRESLHFPRKHRTCGDWARRRERRFFDADR